MSAVKKTTTKKVAAPKKAAAPKSAAAGASVKFFKQVVLMPRVTEKAATDQSINNKFTFLVDRDATKPQIKRAIAAEFNVTPIAVNVVHVEGKAKRTNRGIGRRSDFKKAIVTLPKGQSITVHEGV